MEKTRDQPLEEQATMWLDRRDKLLASASAENFAPELVRVSSLPEPLQAAVTQLWRATATQESSPTEAELRESGELSMETAEPAKPVLQDPDEKLASAKAKATQVTSPLKLV